MAATATTTTPGAQIHLQAVKQSQQTRDPFWLGGAASCSAAFVSHPFDLAKVRMQTTHGASSHGMIGTMINVARHEGIFSLYNGLSASKISVSTMLMCGVLAGCVGGGFGNPADVVNIRMVNDGKLPVEQRRNYKHAFDGLYRIIKDEGPSQLMRGLGPNMYRAVLMTSSQLVSYDEFKRLLLSTPWFKDNLVTHFGSSLLAGLVATTVCAPLDVLKTRIMNSSGSSVSGYNLVIFGYLIYQRF
ncbi:Mitochondrial dicarboxylate transporter [Entomortierella chlamydospora]|uniref:Mitochondrial dicarboxylate transporter n=1 Tax=Entomortierella chlamydospora TaxID=101097 RepID=A0A9P6N1J3_9FUNG|nr:Mitochondrial dicarboxylate transporter [Entomortierella chlamydospora]